VGARDSLGRNGDQNLINFFLSVFVFGLFGVFFFWGGGVLLVFAGSR
jgi:hypothetical protein